MRSERLQKWRIASPCKVAWDDMSGDDRTRMCGECDKEVHNLSAMTSAEADRLLEATGGQVCTYFYRRRDGTVMTSDCPEARWERFTRRVSGSVAATAGLALTVLASISPRAEGSTLGQTLSRLAVPAPSAPPPSDKPILGGPVARATVAASIISETAGPTGTMLTFSSGTSTGVAASDGGYLLDEAGRYVTGSEFVIDAKGLSNDRSQGLTKLAGKAIKKGFTAIITL